MSSPSATGRGDVKYSGVCSGVASGLRLCSPLRAGPLTPDRRLSRSAKELGGAVRARREGTRTLAITVDLNGKKITDAGLKGNWPPLKTSPHSIYSARRLRRRRSKGTGPVQRTSPHLPERKEGNGRGDEGIRLYSKILTIARSEPPEGDGVASLVDLWPHSKNLTTLYLMDTSRTDVGLKELNALQEPHQTRPLRYESDGRGG